MNGADCPGDLGSGWCLLVDISCSSAIAAAATLRNGGFSPTPIPNLSARSLFHVLLVVAYRDKKMAAEKNDTAEAQHRRSEALAHEYVETEGYILEERSGEGAREGGVKLAKDGHTRLIPQPTDDADDPLNWSWGKKHLILLVVSMTAFLPDYGSATGAVTLQDQAV
jgi:hypothetical protein